MNFHRVLALVQRHTFLIRRSPPRMIEMVFWPVMDLFVWGFLTVYLKKLGPAVPASITFLIGAMIFWDIFFRAQQGVTMSFIEDVWAKNLLNLFVAPLRLTEFLTATYIIGLIKVTIIVLVLSGLALTLYDFNLYNLGLSLIPLCTNLLIMGWAFGMFTTALIVRFGQSVEALAWGIPFLVQPLSAVFYPVSALPGWLQPLSLCLPSTHSFEGMRQVLEGKGFPWEHVLWGLGLNVFFLAAAGWFFILMFDVARERGYLAKFGTQ
jgi:ABC-2 type transport system permease protein